MSKSLPESPHGAEKVINGFASKGRVATSRSILRANLTLEKIGFHRVRSSSEVAIINEVRNAFDPNSPFITTWYQIILICIILEILTISYLAVFRTFELPSAARKHLIILYTCEGMLIVDVYIQLNTGYYQNGNIVRDVSKSRRKYIYSFGFLLDLLALFPPSLFPINPRFSLAILEFNKFLRVWRLPKLVYNLDSIYARHFVFLKLCKVVVTTLLVSHFLACGRYLFGYDILNQDNWLPSISKKSQKVGTQYLGALFWAFGILTGGFEGELPHTTKEFAYTIFTSICGIMLFTFLCATFFMISKCENGDTEASEARVNQLKHVLAFHRIPLSLQNQAIEYLKRHNTPAQVNDRLAIKLLCSSIAVDIQFDLLQDIVAHIPIFKGCDVQFIKAITNLLTLHSFPAQFILFRIGDHGDAFYIVNSGVLHTVVNGQRVMELRKGAHTGELAVFANINRTATVVTTTYCTLYKLSRYNADKILEGYPIYADMISQSIQEILAKSESTKISAKRKVGNKKTRINLAQPENKTSYTGPQFNDLIGVDASDRAGPLQTDIFVKKSPFIVPTELDCSTTEREQKKQIFRSATNVDIPNISKLTGFSMQQTSIDQTISTKKILGAVKRLISQIATMPLIVRKKKSLFSSNNKVQPIVLMGGENGIYHSQHLTSTYPHLSTTKKHWYHRLLLSKCIDPESNFRMIWIFILQVINTYSWFVIPLRLVFPIYSNKFINDMWYFDMLRDVVLWVDMYINLNLSFCINSERIWDTQSSSYRYICSRDFFADLLCIFPIGVFKVIPYSHDVLQLPRLGRIWRLNGHIKEVANYIHITSSKKLIFFGWLLLMLYHFIACIYFMLSYFEGYSYDAEAWLQSQDVKLEFINPIHCKNALGEIVDTSSSEVQKIGAMQYFRSLYFAATVLTGLGRTWEPSSNLQYIAALCFMLSGFIITAFVVDNVQKRFTASAYERKEFFATRIRIQMFLTRQQVPFIIHQRINSYLDFWWSVHRGAVIGELLEQLPIAIRRNIIKGICQCALENLREVASKEFDKAFRNNLHMQNSNNCITDKSPKGINSYQIKDQPAVGSYSPATKNSNSMGCSYFHDHFNLIETIIVDNIKFILYGQREVIYFSGDHSNGMYFLVEGKALRKLNDSKFRRIPIGSYFGIDEVKEQSKFTDSAGHAETVYAESGCIVAYLSQEYLREIYKVSPSFNSIMLASKLNIQCRDPSCPRTISVSDSAPDEFPGNTVQIKLPCFHRCISRLWYILCTANIDPDWKFTCYWETYIFLTMTAQSIMIIYQMSFGNDKINQHHDANSMILYFLEGCFFIDIILRFRLGYYEYGNKVMNSHLIRERYCKSLHFAIDLAAICPIDLIWNSPLNIVHLNKLLRIIKASWQFQSLENQYIRRTMEIRLLKLVYYTFLASHFFGCMWFDFANNKTGLNDLLEDYSNSSKAILGLAWLPENKLTNASEPLQYVSSIFWSFGLMSSSSRHELPKTTSQCLFSITTMTVGLFLFAYVVGNFLDIIELYDAENREFGAKLCSLRQLFLHFELPKAIEYKFKTFIFFKHSHSITKEHVLERVLPPSLFVDIRLYQLRPMIVKVAFMAGMDTTVTRMLVSLFTQVIVMKDVYICKYGEKGCDMYFVFTGALDIYVPTQKGTPYGTRQRDSIGVTQRRSDNFTNISPHYGMRIINTIVAGSYVGEAALFTKAPRNASVRAKTSCVLYKLSLDALELVFDRYPLWKRKVLRIVEIKQQQQRLMLQSCDNFGEDDLSADRYTSSTIEWKLTRSSSRLNDGQRGSNNHLLTSPRYQGSGRFVRIHGQSPPNPYKQKLNLYLNKLSVIYKFFFVRAEVQSKYYIIWLHLMSYCTVIMAIIVPYRVFYDALNRRTFFAMCIKATKTFCEIMFWWDIWWHCRVSESETSIELYEHDHVETYIRKYLIWDIAAAFPIAHIVQAFRIDSDQTLLLRVCQLNLCVKVHNLVYYQREIYLRSISYEVNRMKILWLIFLILCYWTSCLYFAVAMYEGFSKEWNTWLPKDMLMDPSHITLKFFRGFFFSITVYTKKGKTFVPETILESFFSIVISFIGQLVLAFMIGEAANMFILYIGNEVEFRKTQIAVEQYFARWKISNSLKFRAHAFLTSWWSSHRGVDYQSMFDEMPDHVRAEGVLHIARLPLKKLELHMIRPLVGNFRDSESNAIVESLMQSIAAQLQFQGYSVGENVIVEGTICTAIYFVVRGNLSSTSCSNKSLYNDLYYHNGDYFGEAGLLGRSVSLLTIRTLRASDLFVLRAEQMQEILECHPYFDSVLEVVQKLVQENKNVREYVVSKFENFSAPNDENQTTVQDSATQISQDLPTPFEKLILENPQQDWNENIKILKQMIKPAGSLHGDKVTPRTAPTLHGLWKDNILQGNNDTSRQKRNDNIYYARQQGRTLVAGIPNGQKFCAFAPDTISEVCNATMDSMSSPVPIEIVNQVTQEVEMLCSPHITQDRNESCSADSPRQCMNQCLDESIKLMELEDKYVFESTEAASSQSKRKNIFSFMDSDLLQKQTNKMNQIIKTNDQKSVAEISATHVLRTTSSLPLADFQKKSVEHAANRSMLVAQQESNYTNIFHFLDSNKVHNSTHERNENVKSCEQS